MVSAHPNAVETMTSPRQPPKLGDFFTPYQTQMTTTTSSMPSIFGLVHESQHRPPNATSNGGSTSPPSRQSSASRTGQASRRSPLANTPSNGSATFSPRPQPLMAAAGENPLISSRSTGNIPKNPKLYKTELCRSWMDHGRCNYGERCQYAHGEAEKRPIPRHPKYKTEACQSYHKTGYCPYGPRCHFIHNEEPAVLQQLIAQNAAAMATVAQQQQQQLARPRNLALQQTLSAPPSTVSTPHPPAPGRQQFTPVLPIGSKPSSRQTPSTESSPVSSSVDSGSESPLSSFSPGLDSLEDPHHSPTAFQRSLFGDASSAPGRWPSTPAGTIGPFSLDFWAPGEDVLSSLTTLSFDDSKVDGMPWNTPLKTASPTRLPVFERLSNNL